MEMYRDGSGNTITHFYDKKSIKKTKDKKAKGLAYKQINKKVKNGTSK
jgi:hypothetical protein